MNKPTRWLNMIDPRVFICKPLQFKKDILIYPPTVEQVLTTPGYDQFVHLFTISQEDIKDELNKKEQYKDYPTPFEFLLINCYHSKPFAEIAKMAFEFFIHKEVNFFYEEKMIVVGNLEETVQTISSIQELVTIKEEEYFDFQNTIRLVVGNKAIKPPEPEDPNEDPRVARIKAKARERDRIKAKKGSQGGISLSTSLVAICCMGIGITPLNIGEMSYASIGPLMNMMQNKEKYDTDIRSLLAGADSKKVKPKYWIRNLDEK